MTAAQPAAPPPAVQSSPRRYGFGGSELGESLDVWRTAAPGRRANGCAGAPGTTGLTICRGADVPLGGGYFARALTYTFAHGRLVRIAFRSSIDAFTFVTANLKRHFSLPDRVVHDTVKVPNLGARAHVQMRWRNGRSTIELSDPGDSPVQLRVSLTQDAFAHQMSRQDR